MKALKKQGFSNDNLKDLIIIKRNKLSDLKLFSK
jgi:hypothetical protein